MLAQKTWQEIEPQTQTECFLLDSLKRMELRLKQHEICPVYKVLTRTALEERWEEARLIPDLAIAFLDIDELKKANSLFGHYEVNKRLAESFALVRENEMIGRFYSGDELVILASLTEIVFPVERILSALRDRDLNATVAIARYSGELSLSDATKAANDKVQELKSANRRGLVYIV